MSKRQRSKSSRARRSTSDQAKFGRLMSRMGNQSDTKDIRLIAFGGIVSNGSGTVSTFIPCDPSSTTFSEWKEASTLYGEIKLLGARLRLTRDSTNTSARPLSIAATLNTASAPTSHADVQDNPSFQYWSPASDTTGREKKVSFMQHELDYASVASPNPGSYAGCPGGFGIYGDNLTTSAGVAFYTLECIFRFRNRN